MYQTHQSSQTFNSEWVEDGIIKTIFTPFGSHSGACYQIGEDCVPNKDIIFEYQQNEWIKMIMRSQE
jgi:hypothetical protein